MGFIVCLEYSGLYVLISVELNATNIGDNSFYLITWQYFSGYQLHHSYSKKLVLNCYKVSINFGTRFQVSCAPEIGQRDEQKMDSLFFGTGFQSTPSMLMWKLEDFGTSKLVILFLKIIKFA